MKDAERRGAPGLTEAERVEGERLLAAMTPGEWSHERHDDRHWMLEVDANEDGGEHDGLCWLADFGIFNGEQDTAAVVWLRNHAAQLLADSADLARERRRTAAMRATLRELIAATDPLVADMRQDWETKRDAELTRRLARDAAMETLDDDALGRPGEEGEGR